MSLAPLTRRQAAAGHTNNSDTKTKLSSQQVVIQDVVYEQKSVNMNKIFESLYIDSEELAQNNLNQSQQADQNNNSMSSQWQGSIKMMDTILFSNGFQPKKWIFTDLLGRIQYKDINSITINDVIRAFLVNLNENKKNEFNNEDLIEFLSNNKNRSKICFAITGNTREFLDITALSDIKNKYPKGIDALQLFKIPTRDFLPYFYYHTLNFKNNGQLQNHMIVRVSHFIKDLGNQKSQRQQEFYEEKIPDEEYDYFAYQMLEISKQIISRIQTKNQDIIVKSIKITYLIESSNYDPWFIGCEYCNLLSRQNDGYMSSRKNLSKSLFNVKKSSSYRQNSIQKRSFVKKIQQDISQSRILDANTSTENLANNDFQTSPEYFGDYSQQSQHLIDSQTNFMKPKEDVYELSQNEYVTQTDLLKGLQQIGEQYGRDQQINNQIKRPRTMQVLTQEKSRRMLKYQQQINEQRNKLKERGRRIVDLFPRFLEKTGSKAHAQFLFGNTSTDRIFKEYQRHRFQKQQNNEQPDILKTESIMQNQTSQNFDGQQLNRSIFDMPMSEIGGNIVHDGSMLTELPYQDGYYNHRVSKSNEKINHTQLNLDFQNLTDVNEQLILNKDISMFQNTGKMADPLAQTQTMLEHNSMKEDSVTSLRDDLERTNNFGDKIANTQKDFLNESFKESKKMDEDKLILAANDFEKNLISLMMINQELENIVVIDKNKALGNIRTKLQKDELKRMIQSQQAMSETGFTGRRKLNENEAQTYYQWKQHLMNNQLANQAAENQKYYQDSQLQQVEMQQNQETASNQYSLLPLVKLDKRSKTAAGNRKSSNLQRKKSTALSLLQIKGKEAIVESGSKLELIKHHVAHSRQQQEQQIQQSINSRKPTQLSELQRNTASHNKNRELKSIEVQESKTKISVGHHAQNNSETFMQQPVTRNPNRSSLGYIQPQNLTQQDTTSNFLIQQSNNLQNGLSTLSATSNHKNNNSEVKKSQSRQQTLDIDDPTQSKALLLRIVQNIQKVADN